MDCGVCNKPIVEESIPDQRWHVNCWPDFEPMPGFHGMTPFDLELREDLIEVIRWADNNSVRSRQLGIGCSEVGIECDRQIAYRMAGIPEVNVTDPLPSIIGTAAHSWMERAMCDFQAVHDLDRWLTELDVVPNPLIPGHCDLYDSVKECVLDYKFPGDTNLSKMRKEGIPANYLTQLQLYGLGVCNSGRPVSRVGLVAMGRQGWLKDILILTVDYDERHAQQALQRIFSLGKHLIELDIENSPQAWTRIPSTPGWACHYCPFYRGGAHPADDKGCPGLKADLTLESVFN